MYFEGLSPRPAGNSVEYSCVKVSFSSKGPHESDLLTRMGSTLNEPWTLLANEKEGPMRACRFFTWAGAGGCRDDHRAHKYVIMFCGNDTLSMCVKGDRTTEI